MLSAHLGPGRHVVVRREVAGWAGPFSAPAARRGARAIVRSRRTGLLGDRCTVEFADGRRAEVRARDLRPTVFGHGEESWRRYRVNRLGIRIGMAILSIAAAIGVVRYYLDGGSTAGLLAALPEAAIGTLLQVGDAVVGAIGLPLAIVAAIVIWRWRRG
jgi:hypothetical protein